MNAVGKAYSKRNGFFGSKTIVMAGKSNGKCGKIHLLQEAATIHRSYSSESGAVHLFASEQGQFKAPTRCSVIAKEHSDRSDR